MIFGLQIHNYILLICTNNSNKLIMNIKKQINATLPLSSDIISNNNNICIESLICYRQQKIRNRTYKSYMSLLNHLKSFHKKKLYIKTIDSTFCHQFALYLTSRANIQINSAKTYLQKLHAILSDAVHFGYIKYNPMPPIDKLLPKYIAKEKDYLNVDEVLRINQSTCSHEMTKLAFLFACYTGLRLSDIETLKWEHIKKHNNYFIIVKFQVKTNKEVRIPLSKQAIEILEHIKSKETHDDDFVFSLYSRSTIYSDLKELSKNANIDKHITFHVSRITFVTLSISAGINIFVISKLCGHHDIKTTQIYSRLLDTTYINAIESLENLFIKKMF